MPNAAGPVVTSPPLFAFALDVDVVLYAASSPSPTLKPYLYHYPILMYPLDRLFLRVAINK